MDGPEGDQHLDLTGEIPLKSLEASWVAENVRDKATTPELNLTEEKPTSPTEWKLIPYEEVLTWQN